MNNRQKAYAHLKRAQEILEYGQVQDFGMKRVSDGLNTGSQEPRTSKITRVATNVKPLVFKTEQKTFWLPSYMLVFDQKDIVMFVAKNGLGTRHKVRIAGSEVTIIVENHYGKFDTTYKSSINSSTMHDVLLKTRSIVKDQLDDLSVYLDSGDLKTMLRTWDPNPGPDFKAEMDRATAALMPLVDADDDEVKQFAARITQGLQSLERLNTWYAATSTPQQAH